MGAVFDSTIGEITEYIETVDTVDIDIYNTSPPAVDLPTDDSPKPPNMVDSVITWGDICGEEAVSVVSNPNIGGLLKWLLIPFCRNYS